MSDWNVFYISTNKMNSQRNTWNLLDSHMIWRQICEPYKNICILYATYTKKSYRSHMEYLLTIHNNKWLWNGETLQAYCYVVNTHWWKKYLQFRISYNCCSLNLHVNFHGKIHYNVCYETFLIRWQPACIWNRWTHLKHWMKIKRNS